MTPDEKLKLLKKLLNERDYPFFEDGFLLSLVSQNDDVLGIAVRLCYEKAAIPDMKLGDITIKSPKDYFMSLASRLKNSELKDGKLVPKQSRFRIARRCDERD